MAFVAGWLPGAEYASAQQDADRVLILYGERRDLPAMSVLDSALAASLRTSGSPVEIFREDLDVSRLGSRDRLALLPDYLRQKYDSRRLGAVVAVTTPAMSFMVEHGADAFPGVPIVFGGMGAAEAEALVLPRTATGVVLDIEFAPTLDLALGLQPGTTQAVLVSGTADLDRFIAGRVLEELEPYRERVQIVHLTDMPLSDVLEAVAALPPTAVVLYSSVFQDGAGKSYVPMEAAAAVSEASAVPVYGFYDELLGTGVVGGHMYRFERQGQELGRLARAVLDAPVSADMPPVRQAVVEPTVDWRALRRWGLHERDLPPGTVIRHREPSLWSQYRLWVIGASVLIGLQALLIAAFITHRIRSRRAEARLQESEARFYDVANTAPVMIFKLDADKRLTFANKVWLDFAGGTLEQHRGYEWTRYVHPDILPGCRAMTDEAYASRRNFNVECRVLRKDGEYRWLLLTGTPRFDGSDFLGYIATGVDVTDRREVELEKQRSLTQLAHLTRVATIGQFTASMAHELNQPLGAILSNAEAASLALEGGTARLDDLRDILADIRDDDLRAAGILDKIRKLLRNEEVTFAPIDVNVLVEDILELLTIEVIARGASLTFEPTPDLPPVLGDRVQLQQVLMNLVVNALDAMAQTPLEDRCLTVEARRGDGETVRISVRDRGCGLSPESVSRAFEPFHTTKEGGLGVGLSITRSIVVNHGGRVWGENNPGGGATFHVLLPRAARTTPDDPPAMRSHPLRSASGAPF